MPSRNYYRRIKEGLRSIYGDTCLSCHRMMRFGGMGCGPYATLDHIIPKSLGGTNDWENLQLLCNDCNRIKDNKMELRIGDGPPVYLVLSPITSPVNKKTIGKFWGDRCGSCGRLDPCLEHNNL